jgi:biopolymer transport protein ExbD
MKKHAMKTSEHVNPNLIPMIDIMFLLLLFFMLGADMGQRDLEAVTLPKAVQAMEDKGRDRLTINAHHATASGCTFFQSAGRCDDQAHWRITFRGEDCTDPGKLATALAQTSHLGAERRVMIRADARAPFGLPQRAMNVCAREGIHKIEVGAALPPQTR